MSRQHITSDEVESKSWVVLWKQGKAQLCRSRWLPGYTSAHTETPEEAIEYAFAQLRERETEIALMRTQVAELQAAFKRGDPQPQTSLLDLNHHPEG